MKTSKENEAIKNLISPAWRDAFIDKTGSWRDDLVTSDITMAAERAMDNWARRCKGYLDFMMNMIKKALSDLKTAVYNGDEQTILYNLTYWLYKLKRDETIDLWLMRYGGREAMKCWVKYPAPQNAEVADFMAFCERRLTILATQNAQRTKACAQERAPGEKWIELEGEENIEPVQKLM